MKYLHYGCDSLVYKGGYYADCMYFIALGKVSMFHELYHLKFRSMIAGGWFGEIEIFENTLR